MSKMNDSNFLKDFTTHHSPYLHRDRPLAPPQSSINTISRRDHPPPAPAPPPSSQHLPHPPHHPPASPRKQSSRIPQGRAEKLQQSAFERGKDSETTSSRADSRGLTMGDYPSLDGFPVQTWGGVGSARVLQRQSRESLPPTASLSSKTAFRQQRKIDGSTFLHSTGEGGGAKPSPYRTSSSKTSGVGKFHLLMADQMFQRRLATAQNVCVDDYVTVEDVVETPKSVKTTFDIEISEATNVGDKSVNQTLKDAEAILNMY